MRPINIRGHVDVSCVNLRGHMHQLPLPLGALWPLHMWKPPLTSSCPSTAILRTPSLKAISFARLSLLWSASLFLPQPLCRFLHDHTQQTAPPNILASELYIHQHQHWLQTGVPPCPYQQWSRVHVGQYTSVATAKMFVCIINANTNDIPRWFLLDPHSKWAMSLSTPNIWTLYHPLPPTILLPMALPIPFGIDDTTKGTNTESMVNVLDTTISNGAS